MVASNGLSADKAGDFYLKEYESLRREIEWLLKDYRALERNVVIAVGLSWAWLFEKCAPKWAWSVPILFAVLGALRASGIIKSFKNYHDYIYKLEDTFSRPGDPGGWEHTLLKSGVAEGAYLFWLILIIATISIAVYRCVWAS
jgi:hypothetical protein